MRHPRLADVSVIVAIAAFADSCQIPELCTPQRGTVGFFSQGDCALTKSSAFRGHEWLTFLANRDLPEDGRFPTSEIDGIIEGNRRVDWPKELLVQMAHSVVAYIQAANELQDRSENQPIHFLLGRDNDTEDAVHLAREVVRDRTRRALATWTSDRLAALTRIGEACHTIQDSFSYAHADRDEGAAAAPWCVRSVKTYIARAPGFELPGDRFHGGKTGDTLGHTTTLDSIYREGRVCNSPQTVEEVEPCLSTEARRAVVATRDYLAVVGALARIGPADGSVDEALARFFDAHMAVCP